MNQLPPTAEGAARLLINCERELHATRRRQARLAAWLDLTQSIAALVSARDEPWQSCTAVCRAVLTSLELQKALFLEILPRTSDTQQGLALRLIRDPRRPSTPLELSATDTAIVIQDVAGVCDNSRALPSLAESLKVERFMWYRMDCLDQGQMLFVAGYDAERSQIYPPFDEGDFGHFKNMGSQVALIFGNVALAREVAKEKEALLELNAQLEERVAERTRELLSSNEALGMVNDSLRDKERLLADDIEQARLFQALILPVLPVSPRIEFGAMYLPLEQVGGDIFDVCEVSANHYRIFMADATGHGVQASMRTILLKAEYDRVKKQHRDPGQTLHELTCRLFELFPNGDIMCTGACVDLMLDDGSALVSLANAASPPLLHYSNTGLREISNEGTFLGIDRSYWPSPTEFRMAPGDQLLSYSDGLSEQTNGQGEYFEHRLRFGVSREWPTASAGLRMIFDDFNSFIADGARSDDVTAVAIRLPR